VSAFSERHAAPTRLAYRDLHVRTGRRPRSSRLVGAS
jgi:hypothetical protein